MEISTRFCWSTARHQRADSQVSTRSGRPQERLAATAYLNVIPNLTRSASPYAVIENVVVDEPLRRTGVGKQIIGATLQAAWNAGCYKAMLLTGSQHASTHAFYRACGFTADEKTAYVARP